MKVSKASIDKVHFTIFARYVFDTALLVIIFPLINWI